MASCYRRAIEMAAENGLGSLAFPNISTGVYGYLADQAARVAVAAVLAATRSHSSIREIIFCCHSQNGLDIYENLLRSRSLTTWRNSA
ncbi:MAG: macro domain-containing protein [Pseudomonadota bacterium]